MILADTNILIDYYRNRNSELAKKIDSLPVALCGVVKAELLHGARNERELDNILESFKSFDLLHTDEYDFEGVGLMLRTLRQNGFPIPLSDMMIAFSAIKYDAELWTRDKHFLTIHGSYPELRFFDESYRV